MIDLSPIIYIILALAIIIAIILLAFLLTAVGGIAAIIAFMKRPKKMD